jgi:ABC-2 type transport system ATP-binding protein
MRAKVALSLAMAHQPDLLVLDEPTSGLDALVRREFLESMVDRAATGQTVFLSSHQIAEVERVADIVAILRKSKLLLVERLDELKLRVRQVTITLPDETAPPPDLSGTVLSQRRRGRQWQALVRDPDLEAIAALGGAASAQTVEIRTPSLEEIFVAYMQLGREGGAEHPDAQLTARKE